MHHCFATIPSSAAARERTRLVNHNELITMEAVSALNLVEAGRADAVALTKALSRYQHDRPQEKRCQDS